MIEPDRWDSVFGSITGTIVHGSISSNRLMDALGVGPDPVLRQKVGKSHRPLI
jgi:hypothetical protein